MMGFHWLLRAARWARHPPPLSRVLLVLGVIAVCAALWGAERAGILPDWLQSERLPGRVIR